MKNYVFCDTIKIFKMRLFHISCKNVYFHGLPGICPVLNNAEAFEAFVGILIIPYLI